MIQYHSLQTLEGFPRLRDSMFLDRKKQFIDRHKWPLNIDNRGREFDQYDNNDSTYVVYTDEKLNHLASMRINLTSANCMLTDIFSEEFPSIKKMERESIEVTRFCISPNLSPIYSKAASRSLISAVFLYTLENTIASSIFGICEAPMLRVYKRIGATPENVRRGRFNKNLVLTEWIASPDRLASFVASYRYQTSAMNGAISNRFNELQHVS